MKAIQIYYNSRLKYLIFSCLFIAFISCDTKKEDNKTEDIISLSDKDEDNKPAPVMIEPEVSFSMDAQADVAPLDRKDFKVLLSVDSLMYLGQSGMMQIWIGEEDIDVKFSKGMATDEKRISSTVGRFAKIVPYAPDFEVKAMSANICYKIDPSGSEIRYSLTPKDEGTYKVSADIELYDTEDCTGIYVPKTASALSVFVSVNMDKEIAKNVHWMEKEVWNKFKVFWVALIALVFGALIFVIRRFVKKKTGYTEP